MCVNRHFLLSLVLAGVLVGEALVPLFPTVTPAVAYLEPGLAGAGDDNVSIIVTAREGQVAAEAVEYLGGQVTSNLWLINSVAALFPAHQLDALASFPGVTSIVSNKKVETAQGPTCESGEVAEDFSCTQLPSGWMSDRREKKSVYAAISNIRAPATFLPDSGFVVIGEHADLLIVNPDGTERVRVKLPDDDFKTSPIVGPDGAIYLARPTKKSLYSLNPDGSIRWVFLNPEELRGGLAFGPDGTVYTVDKKRYLIALNPTNGQKKWVFKIDFPGAGDVENLLTVGADGKLYQIFAGTSNYLYALDPAADFFNMVKWQFTPEPGVKLSYSPVIGPQGLIYVVSKDQKKVYGLNVVTGTQAFVVNTNGKVLAAPILASDGSLYVYTDQNSVYGLNSNGTVRFQWRPPSGNIGPEPTISVDGKTLYVGVDKVLYALDTATGAGRWRFAMEDIIQFSPEPDTYGNVIVGSHGKDLVVLTPQGQISTRLRLEHELVGDLAVGPDRRIIA